MTHLPASTELRLTTAGVRAAVAAKTLRAAVAAKTLRVAGEAKRQVVASGLGYWLTNDTSG